jgi:DNA adenine methylase
MSHQSLDLFPSPLRYPGGKRKVANFVKLLFLENNFAGGEYVEPYAGGASVALALLFESYASHIHINDIDRSLYAFWHAVLDDTEGLCARIHDTKVSVAEWRRQRAVQIASDPDELDLAFSTFFMNRCNRSGIITGGLIGGKHQDGKWKLDARYNKQDLIRRIEKIARFGTRITLTCLDAHDFLGAWSVPPDTPTFIYLDPPYYVKGEGLYENFYEHAHHVDIASRVRHLKVPWMVSYDAAPEILNLYSRARSRRYSLSYSAADRYSGSEVMFFSKGLIVPDVDTPAGIRMHEVDQARRDALRR